MPPIEAGTPTCESRRAELRVLEERASCEAATDCALLGSCSEAEWHAVGSSDRVEGKDLLDAINALCGTSADGPLPSVECIEGLCTVVGDDFDAATEWCGDHDDDAGQE
jgi:hypothetical protein